MKTPSKLQDAAEMLSPGAIKVGGWLGGRVEANATNRLLRIDAEPLLAGFKQKPGSHPWIGEHIGKWMHAATLAWAYTGDPRLREKLDQAVAELVAAQEPDGYLGTYVPDKRFGLYPGADWDVWSHKYNLIGLLTYYEYTGNERALEACRRMGDLLVRTFGPDKKSIISAGTHVGMAATSVLEPMVLLYRFTGEERYLDFCRYILLAYQEPNGPKIIDTLLTIKQVNQTANGKAYEMLSNLVGLCELARATGDRQLLTPILNAWKDIVEKRLYLTGSASQAEHFRADHELPNDTGAHIAETCVTTTWVQLNLQLLRLTGDARFANELERTFYNHLAAAQHPRGDDWCYFTPLAGPKQYDSGIHCCHSSGPRGLALAPQAAYLARAEPEGDALLVATFEPSSAEVDLGGQRVRVRQESEFPFEGRSELRFETAEGQHGFAVHIRVPPWAGPIEIRLNGKSISTGRKDGWLTVAKRAWSAKDRLTLRYQVRPEWVNGTHGNESFAALRWGPFVLSYDPTVNPELPSALRVGFADKPAPHLRKGKTGQVQILAKIRSPRFAGAQEAVFIPFADASASGGNSRVWLPNSEAAIRDLTSILADGEESRSRQGNVGGSINDGDRSTYVVTFNGQSALEDYYAVVLDGPTEIRRVVFVAGNIFHDGGWFDATAGKPRIQVKRERGRLAPWEDVAEVSGYPATTATDCGPLKDPARRAFAVQLLEPITVYGVRVIGKPACGDNPAQAFSSCAELEAQ